MKRSTIRKKTYRLAKRAKVAGLKGFINPTGRSKFGVVKIYKDCAQFFVYVYTIYMRYDIHLLRLIHQFKNRLVYSLLFRTNMQNISYSAERVDFIYTLKKPFHMTQFPKIANLGRFWPDIPITPKKIRICTTAIFHILCDERNYGCLKNSALICHYWLRNRKWPIYLFHVCLV
jgi:hypothetical protein